MKWFLEVLERGAQEISLFREEGKIVWWDNFDLALMRQHQLSDSENFGWVKVVGEDDLRLMVAEPAEDYEPEGFVEIDKLVLPDDFEEFLARQIKDRVWRFDSQDAWWEIWVVSWKLNSVPFLMVWALRRSALEWFAISDLAWDRLWRNFKLFISVESFFNQFLVNDIEFVGGSRDGGSK